MHSNIFEFPRNVQGDVLLQRYDDLAAALSNTLYITERDLRLAEQQQPLVVVQEVPAYVPSPEVQATVDELALERIRSEISAEAA